MDCTKFLTAALTMAAVGTLQAVVVGNVVELDIYDGIVQAPPAAIANMPQVNGGVFALDVKIDPDRRGNSEASAVMVIHDADNIWALTYSDTYSFKVPAGTYTVEAVLGAEKSVVFIPDVKVDRDTEVHVNADMATEKLIPSMTLPGGIKASLPETTDGKTANCPNVNMLNFKVVPCFDGINAYACNYYFERGGDNPFEQVPFRVGGMGSRGSVSVIMIGRSIDNSECYGAVATIAGDRIADGTQITNRADGYVAVNPQISHTPVWETLGDGNQGDIFQIHGFFPDRRPMGGSAVISKIGFDKMYFDPDPDDIGSVRVGRIDYLAFERMAYKGVLSPLMAMRDGCPLWQPSQQGSLCYDLPDAPGAKHLVVNDEFEFADFSGVIFGASNAIASTFRRNAVNDGKSYSFIKVAGCFGNCGELREADEYNTTVTILFDGETVGRVKATDLEAWARDWEKPGDMDGLMTVAFANDNVRFNGMDGQSLCEVSFDTSSADNEPPTLQMLMVADGDGKPQVVLPSEARPVIKLAGGDFSMHSDGVTNWITCGPVDIKVEIAPHYGNEWTTVEAVEHPGSYLMPGYGFFWECDLGIISDGWWDLKVTLTDEAGNTQCQTLSPCFSVGVEASLNPAVGNEDALQVIDKRIVHPLNRPVSIWDLQGRPVVNSKLPSGVYIVRSDSTVQKILVK